MLRIDLAASVPVYEQIANGLRAEFVSGGLAPGDKMPTVRALAIDLGVHHNTVAQAYRQLAKEGWLEIRRHHGAVVRERQRTRAQPDAVARFQQPLRELIARALTEGLSPKLVIREMLESARNLEKGAM